MSENVQFFVLKETPFPLLSCVSAYKIVLGDHLLRLGSALPLNWKPINHEVTHLQQRLIGMRQGQSCK